MNGLHQCMTDHMFCCTINVVSTNLRNFLCFIIQMLLDSNLLLNFYDDGQFLFSFIYSSSLKQEQIL